MARLTRQLEKNLLAYAAASAGVLTIAAPAEAEIVYTASNTPIAIAQQNQGAAITDLDLNNDGTPDFAFVMLSTARFSSFGTTTRFKFFLKVDPSRNANEAVQGPQAPTASALPAGVKIGPQEKFAAGGLYMRIQSFDNGSRSSGTWQNVEYAYVGLKFLINGQTHYGWARIKFPYPGGIKYGSIYGYAYESTPNQPIIAGQTSGNSGANTKATAPATLGTLALGAPGLGTWRMPGESGQTH